MNRLNFQLTSYMFKNKIESNTIFKFNRINKKRIIIIKQNIYVYLKKITYISLYV